MKTTTDLTRFKGYDLSLAKCHMANWGVIYLDDEYEQPIEIEELDFDEIYGGK